MDNNHNMVEEDKMLCVCVGYKDKTRHWFVFDPRSESKEIREIVKMRENHPYRLDRFRGFGIAVLDSKIYLLSGFINYCTGLEREEVYIFDTIVGSWSEGPPLKVARVRPFVQVIGRKIYVFGPQFQGMPVEHWGECYDLDSHDCKEWQTLSGPTQERFYSEDIDAVVVYKDNILFWGVDIGGIYAYNHRSNFWTILSEGFAATKGGGPKPPFNFMSNHAVIGDFALWHYCGKMYAWDLTNHQTYELCTLPGVFPSDPFGPSPSKLLYAGNRLLCLLRRRLFKDKPNVCCYKIEIKGSTQSSGNGGCDLELIPHPIDFFDVPGQGLGFAIALLRGEYLRNNLLEGRSFLLKLLLKLELSGRIVRVEFVKRFKKPSPPRPAVPPVGVTRHKLYVSNLAWKVRSTHLREFFSANYNPVSARVVFDSPAGRSFGYGFVSFATKEEVDDGILALDGKELLGRPLRLTLSEKNIDASGNEKEKEDITETPSEEY